MKKIFCVLLCILMVVAQAACDAVRQDRPASRYIIEMSDVVICGDKDATIYELLAAGV